jgi:hypothetical protein
MVVPMILLISWKSRHLCGGIYRQSLFIFQFRTALHPREEVVSAAGRRELPHVGTPSSHADSFYVVSSFIHRQVPCSPTSRRAELAFAIFTICMENGDDQSCVSPKRIPDYSLLDKKKCYFLGYSWMTVTDAAIMDEAPFVGLLRKAWFIQDKVCLVVEGIGVTADVDRIFDPIQSRKFFLRYVLNLLKSLWATTH